MSIELRWLEYEETTVIGDFSIGQTKTKLQYRTMTQTENGFTWTEWQDVPTVREEKP